MDKAPWAEQLGRYDARMSACAAFKVHFILRTGVSPPIFESDWPMFQEQPDSVEELFLISRAYNRRRTITT